MSQSYILNHLANSRANASLNPQLPMHKHSTIVLSSVMLVGDSASEICAYKLVQLERTMSSTPPTS